MRFPSIVLFLLLLVLPGCGGQVRTAVEKPPFRHYVAAVLTEPSQRTLIDRLKKETTVPPGWTFVAHHMTIAPPGDDAYRLFTKQYPVQPGGKIELRAVAYAKDEKGLAVAVLSTPEYTALGGTNKNPHITVAVAPGAKAFFSNQLLAENKHIALDPPVELTAHVCIVSADSKQCIPDLKGLAEDLRTFEVFLRPQGGREKNLIVLRWRAGAVSPLFLWTNRGLTPPARLFINYFAENL
jgi:hypothetical protein